MLLLSVLGFSFGLYKGFFNTPSLVYAIITSIISWSIYSYYQKKNGGIPYYRLALLFASWGWLLLPKALIISGIFLIGALFERQVKFPYEIAFDPTGIIINTFPKKFFPWGAIQITIDFKNNKLIQKDINEPVSESVTSEFNTFCAEQIDIAKQLTSN